MTFRPLTLPVVVAAATVLAGCAATPPTASTADDTPLIERAKLFGNPTRAAARISPDGQWLTWIAPRDGVLNVWVSPLSDMSQARPLTAEKGRPIRSAFWSPDSKTVLYINDKGGDENFLLYGVDVASGALKAYTPFEKTRVQIVAISPRVKDRILVGVNNRDPRFHDVHSLDLASGQLTLVMKNEGYGGFLADANLNIKLAQKSQPGGGTDFFRVADGKVESTAFSKVGLEDSLTTQPLSFTHDGKTLYWADSRGRDTAALMAQDVASGRSTVVAQDRRADIEDALFDRASGRAQAFVSNYLKAEYQALDPALQADLALLQRQIKGQFTIGSRTDADDKWLLTVDSVSAPVSTWLFERGSKKLTQLFVTRPELEGAPLVPMQALELKTRDGLTMVSYLSLPKSADPGGSGTPAKPVPMVLLVHGGPWARDTYGYNGLHQWLANRGYAVLAVNFRGSTGFGKGYISASNQQWGRKMHDDLLDAVAWAVKQGITTRDKVAIMGGSYGGYATLAGLAFTPKEFACGVDIVGPSNLFTLLKTVPPYWEDFKQQFYRRIGNPETPDGQALLKERSPLNFAHQIERPLLIGQGANDPRVNVAESDQIVDAMKARNIPVSYIVFPDEGHGFARPANNIAFFAVTENFLGRCLGGRAEAIGGTVKASTAQVRHGAEFAPGLAEAIK